MTEADGLVDIRPPRPMWDILQGEAESLRAANLDAISFAIEAIRINLACATFKDEKILLEAKTRLENFNG